MKMEEVFLFGLGERPDPSHVVFAVHIFKAGPLASYSLHLTGSLDLSPFLSVSDRA